MTKIFLDPIFEKNFEKIKEKNLKNKILKQISKIVKNPEIGKPMKFIRKGTREVYIKPFRLSYLYKDNKILILALYHKDNQ